MYYDYYGFRQPPFRITPDTSLFYPGGDRGAILDALVYAILNGEGIVKVVGEVGSGKTMLCRMLEKELPDRVEVVYLVNPSIAPENTLHAIAFELKLDVKPDTSRFEVMNALQQYLLKRHSENRQVVVFVEEAQSMPIATLEEIRLLSNLETQQSKLLQIVLFGQPELDVMIGRPEIRQLKERITYSFQLAPFKTNDIREYINTRVRACGHRAGELFTDAAIREIEQHSKGLLRRINILADKSLLAAFADNAHKVDVRHTRMAARDSEFLPRRSRVRNIWLPGAIISGLLLIGIAFWFSRNPEPPAPLVQMPALPESPAPDNVDMVAPAVPAVAPPSSITEPATSVGIETGTITPVADPPDLAIEPGLAVSAIPVVEPAPDELVQATVIPIPDETTPGPESPLTPEPATALPDVLDSPEPLDINNDLSQTFEENTQISTDLDEEIPGLPDPILSVETTQETPENQLLGMSFVFPLQDLGDNGLSADEMAVLQRQLLRLPPESVENQEQESDICTRCWSIIYRPVPISENL